MTPNGSDGDPQGDGTAVAGQPGTSTQPEGQPSTSDVQLQETLNALSSSFETLSKRVDGLQGKKDKQISSLREQLAEYDKLKEKLGPDGAVDQLELKQTLANMQSTLERLTNPAQTQQTSGPGPAGSAVNAAQVISDFGLDETDPLVQQMKAKTYKSEAEVLSAIRAYNVSKKSQPAPTQAQMPASQTQTQPAPGAEAMKDNYISEMLAARGNVTALRAIKKKYKDQGVPVDSLVIT